jgi:hypothetical protein
MLTRDQVLPFLLHDHPAVRTHALHYLTGVAGPPLISADDLWRAIDHFQTPYDRRSFLSRLRDVPHTEPSLDRLLKTLDNQPDENTRFHLLLTLLDVELPLLLRHRDRILACPHLTEHLRRCLESRIELTNVGLDALWERLLEYSASNHNKVLSTFDDGTFGRLVEALALHGDDAARRALDYITIPSRMDWAEAYCIDVLEKTRYRIALDKLIQVFAAADEEDDVMHEQCREGIPAVAGADAVPPLAQLLQKHDWTLGLYTTGALGRLRDPAAEAALLAVIHDPTQRDIHDHAALNLADLCPAGEAFDALYRMARENDYDPVNIDLKQTMFVLATMTGREIPELRQWRRHADKKERRTREVLQQAESWQLFGPDYHRRVLEGRPPEWAEPRDTPRLDPDHQNQPAHPAAITNPSTSCPSRSIPTSLASPRPSAATSPRSDATTPAPAAAAKNTRSAAAPINRTLTCPNHSSSSS